MKKKRVLLMWGVVLGLALAGCDLAGDAAVSDSDKSPGEGGRSFRVEVKGMEMGSRSIGTDASCAHVYVKVFDNSRSIVTLTAATDNVYGTVHGAADTENGSIELTKVDSVWVSGSFSVSGTGTFTLVAYGTDASGNHLYTGTAEASLSGSVTITASTAADGYIVKGWGPAGGYITYKDSTNGLIYEAAPADCDGTYTWASDTTTATGATAIGYGDGRSNTNTIANLFSTSAAATCRNLTTGGYSYAVSPTLGWFLPSLSEVSGLLQNKLLSVGTVHWTSSEGSGGSVAYAFTVEQYTNYSSQLSKSSTYYVRAVRSFPYTP